jgi:hypothetical protein
MLTVGWIRNFATKNYFLISRNGHIISRNFVDEYSKISRKIGQNFARHCQFGGLDPGNAPNQIVQD